jgi:hypothetical protein
VYGNDGGDDDGGNTDSDYGCYNSGEVDDNDGMIRSNFI